MEITEQIKLEADRCVKCAICLPHCPTYKLYYDEGESPRGRIALLQAIALGELESERAEKHLANCLNCLACQKACPSAVNYGRLIDLHRQHQTELKGGGANRVNLLISKLPYQAMSYPLYWGYQHLGLRPLARTLLGKRFRRLDNLLPRKAQSPSLKHLLAPAENQPKNRLRVGLFTGCIARITDRAALQSATKVLNLFGVDVITPKLQGCCGALHQHSGYPHHARKLAENNHQAFNAQALDAIIYMASGCGLQLAEDQSFNAPVVEICQFINQLDWPAQLQLAPLAAEVMLHTPCTLKNGLGLAHEPMALVKKIPGLTLSSLPHEACCGAAGKMMIEQPELSDRLRAPAIAAIAQKPIKTVLTTNSGCAMHLRAGLVDAKLDIELLHPVELILRQLSR